jgi:hypothetical protein
MNPLTTPESRMAYALLETAIFRQLYPRAEFRIWTAFNLAITREGKTRKFSARANVRVLASLPPLPESNYVARRTDRG